MIELQSPTRECLQPLASERQRAQREHSPTYSQTTAVMGSTRDLFSPRGPIRHFDVLERLIYLRTDDASHFGNNNQHNTFLAIFWLHQHRT